MFLLEKHTLFFGQCFTIPLIMVHIELTAVLSCWLCVCLLISNQRTEQCLRYLTNRMLHTNQAGENKYKGFWWKDGPSQLMMGR